MLSKVTMHWTETVGKHAEETVYPRVDVSVVFPGALSIKELMGCYNEDQATWHDGILTRLIRNANISSKAAKQFVEEQTEKKNKILLNPPSVIDQWIVMDGDLSVGWSEGVGPWLGSCGTQGVCLGHGEQLKLGESTSMIFETLELTKASPAVMSRCAVVHLSNDVVHWKFLIESWIGSAKSCWEVNSDSLEFLQSLISDTFGPTLVFITNQCSTALTADLLNTNQIRLNTVDGIQEVSSFLRIMSALCDKHFMNEELMEPGDQEDPTMASLTKRLSVPDVQRRRASSVGDSLLGLRPRPMTLMSSMFAFAYVWAFGGHLHNRCASKFDQFARELLAKATNDVHFPSDDLVYDYCIDPNLGILVPWGDKNQDRVKTLSTNYTIIPEVERYSGLVDLLVGSNHPVLLTGPPGVGKSALMQNLVQPKNYFVKTSLSPGLTCQSFEDFIVSKLRPRSVAMTAAAGTKQPKGGTSHLFFIDDLHCSRMDIETGVQPCIEVLRQLMSTSGVYDRQQLYHKSLERPNFVAACIPPSTVGIGSGTSSHVLSPRITRLFTVVSFFVHSDEAMQLMHGSSLQGWLEEFPAYSLDHLKELTRALLSATLHLHGTVVNQLPSSPINPQYIFSQHDIHRIISGLYLMSPRARARPRHGGGGGGGRRGAGGGGGGRPQGAGDGQRVIFVPK
ncbi:dynein heavy chain domain-containing protein 1-like [Amphiura filiformis]|uniref:dynein heavy chain domain-containing protein 1-like n=1 Tax=Amphiura filiformis TaxID=82378 RepID=UPI003B216A32